MKIQKWIYLLIALGTNVNADIQTKITMSGISSGAFMANQLSVIYSDQIAGVGMIAGGFYGCAENHFQNMYNLSQANGTGDWSLFSPGFNNPVYQSVNLCMTKSNQTHFNIKTVKKYEQQKLISSLKNISKQKIYIYHGNNDSVISPVMKNKVYDMYTELGLPEKQLFVSDSEGGHNFPTDRNKLNPCRSEEIPYLGSCEKNVAGELLNFLVSPNLIRTSSNKKLIYKVNQLNAPDSIADYGYLASNQFCISNPKKCKLHVVFHGCKMSDNYDSEFDSEYQKFALLGYFKMRNLSESLPMSPLPYIEQKKNKMGLLQFVQQSGYVDYVEKNRLMILFPQTEINKNSYPYNPKGCWDWIGTTGPQYLTNQGLQPKWLISFMNQIQQAPLKYIRAQ